MVTVRLRVAQGRGNADAWLDDDPDVALPVVVTLPSRPPAGFVTEGCEATVGARDSAVLVVVALAPHAASTTAGPPRRSEAILALLSWSTSGTILERLGGRGGNISLVSPSLVLEVVFPRDHARPARRRDGHVDGPFRVRRRGDGDRFVG